MASRIRYSLEILEPTRFTENIIIIFLLFKVTVKCYDEVLNKMYSSQPIYPKSIFYCTPMIAREMQYNIMLVC